MKSILITGAGSGIGRSTAELFYRSGWYIGLVDISKAALEAVSASWDTRRFFLTVADVTEPDQVKTALEGFHAVAKSLDVLFNCAGVLEIGDFESIPLQRHHQILDINNKGLLNCCYLALPYLQQSQGARVINMSSASSLYGVPGFASYSASKFWVKGFTEALSTEWSRYGILVMDIEPPFVRSPMLEGKQAKIIERMGVNLKPEDIAAAVMQAVKDSEIHHPVSSQYKLMRRLSKVLPDNATRLLMKAMSGY